MSRSQSKLEHCEYGYMWLVQTRADPKAEWSKAFYTFYRVFAEMITERFEEKGAETSITLEPYNPWCLGERELQGSPALPTL